MSRIHSSHRGSSGSDPPLRDEQPDWVELSPAEVEEEVLALREQGLTQAEIGLQLRDRLGVGDVREVSGQTVREILATHDAASEIPEDLMALMERAVRLHEHLQDHAKDNANRRGLRLIESKIRRLVDYHKDQGNLDPDWRYSIDQAQLLTE